MEGLWFTYDVLLVGLVEQLLQQPGPEVVEGLLQVDVGGSAVAPQLHVQVGEDRGVLGVKQPHGGGEGLLQGHLGAIQQLLQVT